MLDTTIDDRPAASGEPLIHRGHSHILALGILMVVGCFLPLLIPQRHYIGGPQVLIREWAFSSWAERSTAFLWFLGPAVLGCIAIASTVCLRRTPRTQGIVLLAVGGGLLLLTELLACFLGVSYLATSAYGSYSDSHALPVVVQQTLMWGIFVLGWLGVFASFRVTYWQIARKGVYMLGLIGACCMIGVCLLPVHYGPNAGAFYLLWPVPTGMFESVLAWLVRVIYLGVILAVALLAIQSAPMSSWASRRWAACGMCMSIGLLLLLALLKAIRSVQHQALPADYWMVRFLSEWTCTVLAWSTVLMLLAFSLSNVLLTTNWQAARIGGREQMQFTPGPVSQVARKRSTIITLAICAAIVSVVASYGLSRPSPHDTYLRDVTEQMDDLVASLRRMARTEEPISRSSAQIDWAMSGATINGQARALLQSMEQSIVLEQPLSDREFKSWARRAEKAFEKRRTTALSYVRVIKKRLGNSPKAYSSIYGPMLLLSDDGQLISRSSDEFFELEKFLNIDVDTWLDHSRGYHPAPPPDQDEVEEAGSGVPAP